MTAYYNEIDPYAAAWLRNLILYGLIAPGDVDTRSIEDVHPNDLRSYTQCHFFAGIGVWSHALRLAGWADDRPVWTGSCPCQPFSQAGKGKGFADERHLWPAWLHLIRECRPVQLIGEQVSGPDGLKWLDVVHTDLEAEAYAFGAVDICAAGVGAPHIRQRLYWLANDDVQRREGLGLRLQLREPRFDIAQAGRSGEAGYVDLGDADDAGSQGRRERRDGPDKRPAGSAGVASELANADAARREGLTGGSVLTQQPAARGFWSDAEWIPCRDGRWRPVEPGTFPLVNGAPARVGRLRAYGNALVGPLAAKFIKAVMSVAP
jgi:DNA (cytosine-5)-methyltransferase 1